jgi:hypothetical protein
MPLNQLLKRPFAIAITALGLPLLTVCCTPGTSSPSSVRPTVTSESPVEQFRGQFPGSRRFFDEQTLLKKWQAGGAADLTDVSPDRRTEFAPVIRKEYKLTGQTKPPVAVVRCSPGTPVFDLDFDKLDIGCYVVRVIAAVRTEDIEQYRKPLYVELGVNDQPGGGQSRYRQRVPYWDEFYAVAELYFNVDEKRGYRGTLTVGEGSLADLYVHSIELHDVLGGLPGVAAKTKPSLYAAADRAALRKNVDGKAIWEKVNGNVELDAPLALGAEELTGEARRQRDEVLWNAFPSLNSQFVADHDEGFVTKDMRPGLMTAQQAAEKYGTWQLGNYYRRSWRAPLVFENEKLGLRYTRDDFAQHRPLPDPYPFKDDGMGVYFPKTNGMEHAEHYLPIAQLAGLQWISVWSPLATWHGEDIQYRLPYLYHALDHRNAARDAAFLLCRWAYTYPTHTDAQSLGYALISPWSYLNRDARLVQRALAFYWGGCRGATLQQGLALSYDYLFDYIQGN